SHRGSRTAAEGRRAPRRGSRQAGPGRRGGTGVRTPRRAAGVQVAAHPGFRAAPLRAPACPSPPPPAASGEMARAVPQLPGPGPALSSPVHRGELLRGAPTGGTGTLPPPSNSRGTPRGPPATLARRHGGGDNPRSTDVGSLGPGGRQGVRPDRGLGGRGRGDGRATDQDGRDPCLRVGNRRPVAPCVRGPGASGGDWSRARLFGSLGAHGVPERAHLRPSP